MSSGRFDSATLSDVQIAPPVRFVQNDPSAINRLQVTLSPLGNPQRLSFRRVALVFAGIFAICWIIRAEYSQPNVTRKYNSDGGSNDSLSNPVRSLSSLVSRSDIFQHNQTQ